MIRAAPPIPRPPNRTLSVDGEAVPKHLGHSALEALRLQGSDCINTLFEYQLVLRTREDIRALDHDAANWDLDSFIGKPLSCRIRLDGQLTKPARPTDDRAVWRASGRREINGIVVSADLWGDDGDQAQYRLVLRPTLFRATLVVQSRTFIDMGVDEILRDLLRDIPRVAWRLRERYPRLEFQAQYNESDFAFFERICQEWGISYHFTHADGHDCLVLSDRMDFLHFQNAASTVQQQGSEDYHRVEYHAPGWKTDTEYLHKVSVGHRLVPERFIADDHDYTMRHPLLVSGADPMPDDGPGYGTVREWHGGAAPVHFAQQRIDRPFAEPDALPGDREGQARRAEAFRGHVARSPLAQMKNDSHLLSTLRLEWLRTGRRRLHAAGNLRAMVPGHVFDLDGHPHHAANTRYLIVETNFLFEETGQRSRDGADTVQRWRTEVELVGHPVDRPLRPTPTRAKPFIRGPQPATVVGPPGRVFHTDALGRIMVRFHWDIAEHDTFQTSGWIRVCSPSVGNGRGAVAVPRVGEEVLIAFTGGDPDLPVCVGSVHTQTREPPWLLPQEAALSGIRSQEIPEKQVNSFWNRGNHLVFDDTRDAIQVQLKSDHRHSQLSLGRISRIEDYKGRKDARGEGFDLRTDAHGVLRAGMGLILSTHARDAAAGGMKDIQESLQLLTRAQEQLQSHADAAAAALAQDPDEQPAVAENIAVQNAALRGTPGAALGELDAPHLLAASSAGVVAAAAQDLHLAAGRHIVATSAGHTSLSTGGSLLATAGRAIRMVAWRGMRLFAAQGDLELQAQGADLRLKAKHTAELASTDGWVNVTAREGIRLNVGGTCIEITAAQIALLTEGRIAMHSAGQTADGPKSRAQQINEMPNAAFDDRYQLCDGEDKPIANRAWKARRADGSVISGRSDAAGFIELQRGDSPENLQFEFS